MKWRELEKHIGSEILIATCYTLDIKFPQELEMHSVEKVEMQKKGKFFMMECTAYSYEYYIVYNKVMKN